MRSRESSVEGPCHSCPKYTKCTKPCERLEAILPNEESGKTWREERWEFSSGNPRQQALWGLTDNTELHRLFWHSWDKLTPRQREALMLRKREHMSFEQIGDQMKISKTAAFKLCQKALKGLTNSPSVGAFLSEE